MVDFHRRSRSAGGWSADHPHDRCTLADIRPKRSAFRVVEHPEKRTLRLVVHGPDGKLIAETYPAGSSSGMTLESFDGHHFRPFLAAGNLNDLRNMHVRSNGEIWAGGTGYFGVYRDSRTTKMGPGDGYPGRRGLLHLRRYVPTSSPADRMASTRWWANNGNSSGAVSIVYETSSERATAPCGSPPGPEFTATVTASGLPTGSKRVCHRASPIRSFRIAAGASGPAPREA